MSKLEDLDELIQEAFAYGCNYQSQLTLENPTNAEKFLKEKESLRELGKDYVLIKVEDCPNCDNSGSYMYDFGFGPEQQQCQFCYTVPNSRFNVEAMIKASE